jgi:hypothetical protein
MMMKSRDMKSDLFVDRFCLLPYLISTPLPLPTRFFVFGAVLLIAADTVTEIKANEGGLSNFG